MSDEITPTDAVFTEYNIEKNDAVSEETMVARLLARSSEERVSVYRFLYTQTQKRVTELEKEVVILRQKADNWDRFSELIKLGNFVDVDPEEGSHG